LPRRATNQARSRANHGNVNKASTFWNQRTAALVSTRLAASGSRRAGWELDVFDTANKPAVSEERQARRSSRRTADEIPATDQPQDRKGSWPQRAAARAHLEVIEYERAFQRLYRPRRRELSPQLTLRHRRKSKPALIAAFYAIIRLELRAAFGRLFSLATFASAN
jgi:hypothetical protein